MEGNNLSEKDRIRIVEVVRKFAGDDLNDAALWMENEEEQVQFPGAYVNGMGIHFDSRLLKTLDASNDDYLAFIVLHEISHLVHAEFGGKENLDDLDQEVRASVDARNGLVEHGVVLESR